MNKEKCPLMRYRTVSEVFDYFGGVLLIEEHAVKITIPVGAIDEDCVVQIEAAASLFGPFVTPEDYDPISAYVWVGACYEFKKKLQVEIEHDIVVSEETNFSELCVLTAHEDGELLMHQDNSEYYYEMHKTTCTISAFHFCSKCLAARGKAKKAKRIIMYHYLPEDYRSEYEFVAEVCFCYDLQYCKERTEERYTKRRMEQESSAFIRLFNWKKDKILLSYLTKFQGWEVYHMGDKEIISDALDFRLWYDSVTHLRRDEHKDQFPPRFRLKIIKKFNPSDVYKYNIYVQSKNREDKELTLIISGIGRQFLNEGNVRREQPLEVGQIQTAPSSSSSQQQFEQCPVNNQQHSQAEQPLSSALSQQQMQPTEVDQQQSAAAPATGEQQSNESSQAPALGHFTSFSSPQLPSVLPTAMDQTTNTTYIFVKGDNNTISLPTSSDGPPPGIKTKFNSLQPFAEDIANSVDVDVILPVMIQQDLVTPDQQQDLINPSMPSKKQTLSGIILGLPEDCVNNFLDCLVKTSHYKPHRQLYDKCSHIAS